MTTTVSLYLNIRCYGARTIYGWACPVQGGGARCPLRSNRLHVEGRLGIASDGDRHLTTQGWHVVCMRGLCTGVIFEECDISLTNTCCSSNGARASAVRACAPWACRNKHGDGHKDPRRAPLAIIGQCVHQRKQMSLMPLAVKVRSGFVW